MDPLEELRALAPPPADPLPRAGSGDIALPADYAELARAYGLGSFGGFLWLLIPGAENPNLELGRQAELRRQDLREVRDDGETLPYEPEELLPWAITDNGDTAYWRTGVSDDPDAWTVTVNEGRGPDWHDFDGTATAFLAAWLAGRERPSVFPDDVPGPGGFDPLPL